MKTKQFRFLPLAMTALLTTSILVASRAAVPSKSPSFDDFDRRARAGEKLNVVFFGASLTWGANASDPLLTSYRSGVANKLERRYPRAHFTFGNAAIGGTGSQLGVFRLDRDVLRHRPDLVFLDFTANDDIYSGETEKHASYESLVRRIVRDGNCPVVQVIFPFQWNIKAGEMPKMKRRDAHYAISRHYHTAVGDAVSLATQRVDAGTITPGQLWPFDGVHPGDEGYALFADAAWRGFEEAVQKKVSCIVPSQMLYAPTYMTYNRARLAQLGEPPAGWKVAWPNRVSAYFDSLMSRWQEQQLVAQRGNSAAENPARLKLRFQGSMAMLFGEGTLKSGRYRVYLDGTLLEQKKKDQVLTEFDAGNQARPANGNTHHIQPLATGLDASVWHSLEIEPVFQADTEQEIRIESLCVAGGAARVELLP